MDVPVENQGDTRQRVLAAAAEVFAEKGFEKATVREIVERAQANLNAINYYFRDKRGLYLALFEHAHQDAMAQDRREFARMRTLPPQERLRGFVEYILRGLVLKKHTPWKVRLLLREMTEPTWVLSVMVERFIRPRFDELASIVRELVPPDTADLKVRLCAESIVAQCVHIAHGRAIVTQLIPELVYAHEGIGIMADHVTEFSLAALKTLADRESGA
ncbi:MAG: CerR family C-terminal domain-containing protein [Planctomycetes bacterium]|nr:CerR family C-terminal domain-containing protein [Planctomycetota bacterium]